MSSSFFAGTLPRKEPTMSVTLRNPSAPPWMMFAVRGVSNDTVKHKPVLSPPFHASERISCASKEHTGDSYGASYSCTVLAVPQKKDIF